MNPKITFTVIAFLAFAGVARAQSGAPDLSALHDALHLTASQEDGWRAYRAAITPDPQSEARHRQAAMMLSTLPTPRRVDLIDAEMQEDMTTLHRQGLAVKAFYATLTLTQQRTFDQQTAPSGQRGGSTGGSLRQPPNGAMRQPQ